MKGRVRELTDVVKDKTIKEWIELWFDGDQSIKAFCKEHGLSTSAMTRWVEKFLPQVRPGETVRQRYLRLLRQRKLEQATAPRRPKGTKGEAASMELARMYREYLQRVNGGQAA